MIFAVFVDNVHILLTVIKSSLFGFISRGLTASIEMIIKEEINYETLLCRL